MTPPSAPRRVLAVIGTRPEAIKMAPVIAALQAQNSGIECRLALTGQHTTLVDRVLDVFSLEPSYDLAIMREGQSLYDVAQGCLDGLRGAVRDFRPDLVLVQGDTATVFFSSLVAFFEKVKVGHVEAGLRSGDKWAPYPEEIFRRLSDVLSDLYFAPTPSARANLLREGVPAERIFVTGNTVVDALQSIAAREGAPADPGLREILESGDPLVLLTAHRRESFGAPLREAFAAVREIADRGVRGAGEPGSGRRVRILYPVHPNPEVRGPAEELLGDHPRIHLTEPLDYFDLVTALRHAVLVLTDSGGIQEEAPTFGAPVLVLREVTERPEGVATGVAVLVGTDHPTIVREALRALQRSEPGAHAAPAGSNPYGDGKAAQRIADIIRVSLEGGARRTEDWPGP